MTPDVLPIDQWTTSWHGAHWRSFDPPQRPASPTVRPYARPSTQRGRGGTLQVRLLALLQQRGDLAVKQMAQAVKVKRASVVMAIWLLGRKGLVTRVDTTRDREARYRVKAAE